MHTCFCILQLLWNYTGRTACVRTSMPQKRCKRCLRAAGHLGNDMRGQPPHPSATMHPPQAWYAIRQLLRSHLPHLSGRVQAALALSVEGTVLGLNGCQDTVTLALAHKAHPWRCPNPTCIAEPSPCVLLFHAIRFNRRGNGGCLCCAWPKPRGGPYGSLAGPWPTQHLSAASGRHVGGGPAHQGPHRVPVHVRNGCGTGPTRPNPMPHRRK